MKVGQKSLLDGSRWYSKHCYQRLHLLGKREVPVEVVRAASKLAPSTRVPLPVTGEVSLDTGQAARMLLVAFSLALAALLAAISRAAWTDRALRERGIGQ
jgi:hypothetical protein